MNDQLVSTLSSMVLVINSSTSFIVTKRIPRKYKASNAQTNGKVENSGKADKMEFLILDCVDRHKLGRLKK